MKKIIFFVFVISLFSCSEDPEMEISNDLKQRVLLLESYDPYGSFVSDSIIEYYENKLIISKDHFYRRKKEDPYIPVFRTFDYNQDHLLIEINSYNDSNLSDHYSSTTYFYNKDNSIQKISSEKFKASNLFSNLYSQTSYYEYENDTIRTYHIDHLDNDKRTEDETYFVKDNLGSLEKINSKQLYLFNDENNCYKIKYLGNPEDTYFSYETDINYGNNRQALINNGLGSTLNLYIIPDPTRFYTFELAGRYIEEYYYKGNRADNVIRFNYIFDDNDRLQEVKTSGTFATTSVIRYFYD